MGNAVFAGAAMLLPIGVSAVLSTITPSKLAPNLGGRPDLRPRAVFLGLLGLWVMVLGRNDEAIRLYWETVALVPASWPLHNRLAEAYIDVSQHEMAMDVLDRSLAITQNSDTSAEARRLQALATEKLSDLDDSTAPVP